MNIKLISSAILTAVIFSACSGDKKPEMPDNLKGYEAKEIDFFGGGAFNREPVWLKKSGREGKFAEVGHAVLVKDKDPKITKLESYVDAVEKLRDQRIDPAIKSLGLENEEEFKTKAFEVLKTVSSPKYEYRTNSGDVFTYVAVDETMFFFNLENSNVEIPADKMKEFEKAISQK